MRTSASIYKHPIHPMLVVFPIGLWIFLLACDLIRLAGASPEIWSTVALITMVGGQMVHVYGVGVEGRE